MKIAIMQPYVFPYIGYFQLINAVDIFVFYDDVNFIKKGFINRNTLLVEGKKQRFIIPCRGISQNKYIKDVELFLDDSSRAKFLRTLKQAYKKAPFFEPVLLIIEEFINNNTCKTISEFAIESVKLITHYLDIKTEFCLSSVNYKDSIALKKRHRLIHIAKKASATTYINPIGGLDLYNKEDFCKESIELQFLKSNPIVYTQFTNDFVPWLSMIDVLMFNSLNDIKSMLNDFELI